jgi:hypothetical protein
MDEAGASGMRARALGSAFYDEILIGLLSYFILSLM